jgi:hypothetical protein
MTGLLQIMNGKGCGRKIWWPNYKVLPGTSLEGLRRTTEHVRIDVGNRSPYISAAITIF